jgi:hypothetical protein
LHQAGLVIRRYVFKEPVGLLIAKHLDIVGGMASNVYVVWRTELEDGSRVILANRRALEFIDSRSQSMPEALELA